MRNNSTPIIIILVAAFILRVVLVSHWLEDWDSVQFALALHNFSIADHQPHPPGYPLYILLGKLLNFFLNSDTLSLTLASTILGSASAIPLFLLTSKMASQQTAFLAALILLVTPVHWMLSEVALSNMPGMFFAITTAYLLYKGHQSKNYLFVGSLLGGITLGVRFAEWSIVIALLLLVLICNKKFSVSIKSIILFLFGVLIWLVPLLIDTGLTNFLNAYTIHASYILRHDSLVQYTSILERLSRIWELFLMGFSIYFIPLVALVIFHLIKSYNKISRWNYLFLSVWLLSYLIPLIFIYNLEVPRHVLPLLPPLAIFSALSMQNLNYRHATSLIFIIIVLLFTTSFGQVKQAKSSIPPSIAPVLYIKENFNPGETTLITTFIYRQFQYYAPEFSNFYGSQNLPEEINSEYVILDFLNIKEQLPVQSSYNISDVKTFSGPPHVFPRISQINLYVLKKGK